MSDRELTEHMQAMCEILVRVSAVQHVAFAGCAPLRATGLPSASNFHVCIGVLCLP